MITDPSFVVEFDLSSKNISYLDAQKFAISDDPDKIYWIHCDLLQAPISEYLMQQLSLDQDVVELLSSVDQASKIVEKDDKLTLQFQCLFSNNKLSKCAVESNNFGVHLSDRFCLTASRGTLIILDALLESLPSSIQYARTPCFILFLALDNIITHYTEILYEYEIQADDLDLRINEDIYSNIKDVKKCVIDIKRHTTIILNILMYTTARDIKAISKFCRVSLTTLLNNTQLVASEADSIRELLNSTLDQIDNALMRQVNSTMRVLTAIAAVFMPPSLVAAIYGMNFQVMPELSWKYGYIFALALMLLSMVVMLYYFKKNKWY